MARLPFSDADSSYHPRHLLRTCAGGLFAPAEGAGIDARRGRGLVAEDKAAVPVHGGADPCAKHDGAAVMFI